MTCSVFWVQRENQSASHMQKQLYSELYYLQQKAVCLLLQSPGVRCAEFKCDVYSANRKLVLFMSAGHDLINRQALKWNIQSCACFQFSLLLTCWAANNNNKFPFSKGLLLIVQRDVYLWVIFIRNVRSKANINDMFYHNLLCNWKHGFGGRCIQYVVFFQHQSFHNHAWVCLHVVWHVTSPSQLLCSIRDD